LANQFFAGVGGVKVIKKPNNKKSFALITALGLCILFGAIITGVFMSSVREISSTKRQIGTTQALWLAESAAREKIQEIKVYFDTGEFPKHFPIEQKDIGEVFEWSLPETDRGSGETGGTGHGHFECTPEQLESINKNTAQLISVDTYGSGAGKPPIPGDYIYLLTASATVPILGGSTSKTVQCSVKYSYVAPMNIEVGDATIGEDGELLMGGKNIIYFANLGLPAGKYDISYSAKYHKLEGPNDSPEGEDLSYKSEDIYITLGKTELLLEEWVDDGEGFDETGEFPCVAGDGIPCYGEYNIPWDLQTGFIEHFAHVAGNGVNDSPEYFFQVDDEPLLGQTLCLQQEHDPTDSVRCVADCDLEEGSACYKMCSNIDKDCKGIACRDQCFNSCLEILQPEHPDSECHRRCDPDHCMRWCAREYQFAYGKSGCVQECCAVDKCDTECIRKCLDNEELGTVDGYYECRDFCALDNPGQCMQECLDFQEIYHWLNVRPGIANYLAYRSECHRLCDSVVMSSLCYSNCDANFACDGSRGNLLIRSEVPQYAGQIPYLQGAIEFENFDIIPESSGATIGRIQWLTNVE